MVRPVLSQRRSTVSIRNSLSGIVAVGIGFLLFLNLWYNEEVSRTPLTELLTAYNEKYNFGTNERNVGIAPDSPHSPKQEYVVSNIDSAFTTKDGEPIKIAHAISLITCKRLDRVIGFLDALVILRHSIHQNSIHNQRGQYSYQMYAIIHPDGGCVEHVHLLQRLGYIPIIRETPVNLTASLPTSSWYLNHVESENCCGSKEFIKLYAYTLTDHPLVVHWDLDVLVLKPMDDLYDAMIFDATSPRGAAARAKLQIQRPGIQKLPERIDAFFTRDITSARPWENITAVQGGFVVARPSMENFRVYQDFISKGDFKPGRGPGSGWAGLGYGGFQGAMAYQGVLAYFYDQIYPDHSVELDVCHWNQVVADVVWRGPARREEFYGKCRDYPPDHNFADNTPENGACHDCRSLPVDQTRTVHYTACKKPWECRIPHPRHPRDKSQAERIQELTNITTCKLLFSEYFLYRRDVEDKINAIARQIQPTRDGNFERDAFRGYCAAPGKYIPMALPESFDMKNVYGF